MWEIWVEWENGNVECVDEANNKQEAIELIDGYREAFGPHNIRRVWKQRL